MTLRSGSGASLGVSGFRSEDLALVWKPAGTTTGSGCGSCAVAGAAAATVPSAVKIAVVLSPFACRATPTSNAVPRTEAVTAGVRTSYLEPPLMSFVTTCHVRPRLWVMTTTVLPSGEACASSIARSLDGSIATVEPSKYVSTARASTAVRMMSPGERIAPSTAASNGAP